MEIVKITCFFALLIIGVTSDGSPKRGLGANDDGFGETGSSVNWMYNWYSNTTNKQNFTEYVPMLWGINSELTGIWNKDASSWIAAGSEYLLAFNEPENIGQSNISPAVAADAYRQYMEPFAGKAQLGAPGVSNDGRDWMKQFLGLCSDCTIDFVPIHWYNPCSLLDDFMTFVTDMCHIARDRPVWVTEFQPEGSTDEKTEFLKRAISWLDDQECVARYAYFGTADVDLELLDHGGPALSALGAIYAFTPFEGTNTSQNDAFI
ncbi:hypothetical protein F5883DRAFT_599047 [Diaporthe sp. PMI_573]|nr:hypothetical protein F5883DRAFT_599047 [Diaporthaceae sp. PMI_573]